MKGGLMRKREISVDLLQYRERVRDVCYVSRSNDIVKFVKQSITDSK